MQTFRGKDIQTNRCIDVQKVNNPSSGIDNKLKRSETDLGKTNEDAIAVVKPRADKCTDN